MTFSHRLHRQPISPIVILDIMKQSSITVVPRHTHKLPNDQKCLLWSFHFMQMNFQTSSIKSEIDFSKSSIREPSSSIRPIIASLIVWKRVCICCSKLWTWCLCECICKSFFLRAHAVSADINAHVSAYTYWWERTNSVRSSALSSPLSALSCSQDWQQKFIGVGSLWRVTSAVENVHVYSAKKRQRTYRHALLFFDLKEKWPVRKT